MANGIWHIRQNFKFMATDAIGLMIAYNRMAISFRNTPQAALGRPRTETSLGSLSADGQHATKPKLYRSIQVWRPGSWPDYWPRNVSEAILSCSPDHYRSASSTGLVSHFVNRASRPAVPDFQRPLCANSRRSGGSLPQLIIAGTTQTVRSGFSVTSSLNARERLISHPRRLCRPR